MASYIEINDLGSFASINALWAAYPEGGQEGDYCTIDGVKYRWDKYDRMWVADPNFGPTPARNVDTFYGDVNIHNNLTVAGTLRAKGINNPCVGFFPSEEALEEKWPTPKVGWWAIVGDTIPGEIYHCVTEGEWTDSGETGGSGEIDLTEYAKLTDIPEIADDLVTNSGTKTLSARQGKILNEKIPLVVDSLTSTSSISALSAKQGKVLNEKIPPVVDNLTTSSPTKALSAKQGKALKTLVDNIGSINVHGIQGFWPIDSLDDLPLSPTLEQKRQAYLYENALYIYVGEGGDTLDGKYKSTQLVTLDWNDKAYAPSIYNGLGRMTLKKNMVEGVNVLTSAMIGTNNTEYFIQYDYDLNGATVTLPANASLVFMGGSIKNGILVGNNTRIVAKRGVCIFDGITIQGTWDVVEAYSSWFKMHKKGYKIKDVTEEAVTLYKGTDNNYYDFEDLTLVGSDYYVTSTLVSGEVVESSIKVTATTYATFRVEGYNADSTIDYVAAPAGVPGAFVATEYEQYNDTAALQSFFDIRAKKMVIEEGIYMVKCDTAQSWDNIVCLYFDGQNDCEVVFEGWLKAIPNSLVRYNLFDVIGCKNIHITGNGGIQGDLLEHTGSSGEYGHLLSVSNTKGLTVENITLAYAWGDCAYTHWWSHGRESVVPRGNDQKFHTYRNVSFIYGGRTGYVSERGDNVVVDSCYFYGTGRIRGKATNSAVDIEPFNYADASQRYVKNYEFRNNHFENSANGLRLERCLNCTVRDNFFDFGWSGVIVVQHTDASYDISSSEDRGWIKSHMKIYNNSIKRCSMGIILGESYDCDNIEIYGNMMASCDVAIYSASNKTLTDCSIHDNITYGCGQWNFTKLVNCDIYNNKNYGCRMPMLTPSWGVGRILYIYSFDGCANSSFHNNKFSLDYGKSIFGLGEYGKEEFYHGLPVGYRYSAVSGANVKEPAKIHFYDNDLSDDFFVYYGNGEGLIGNNYFRGGMASVKDESNEVFLEGDVFKSKTYGDEGVVTSGGIMSCSWLDEAREFEPYMEVAYGEIIKLGTRFKICSQGGTCGESLTENQGVCGTATFLTYAVPYGPDSTSAGHINIAFRTRGVCTSETRPETFLFAGRRMWETDTNKEIVYNGAEWVYDDIYITE